MQAVLPAVSIEDGPVVTTPPTRQGCFPSEATIRDVVERVLLASPRGYCARVERAVETVELALQHYGPPVYVRKQIVHNIHVVRDLEARGARRPGRPCSSRMSPRRRRWTSPLTRGSPTSRRRRSPSTRRQRSSASSAAASPPST